MIYLLQGVSLCWGKDVKLIYRHYATLYFIFAVDKTESELGILDLIQVRAVVQFRTFHMAKHYAATVRSFIVGVCGSPG